MTDQHIFEPGDLVYFTQFETGIKLYLCKVLNNQQYTDASFASHGRGGRTDHSKYYSVEVLEVLDRKSAHTSMMMREPGDIQRFIYCSNLQLVPPLEQLARSLND